MTIERVYKGKSIDKVVRILGKEPLDTKLIAGGTDIMIQLRKGEISPKGLIDISNIEELSIIEDKGEFIEIGGATSFTQVVDSPLFKENLYGLNKACGLVGSPQIRNMGTIGGNIVNNSSAADSIPPLISLDSMIVFKSIRGERKVLLEDYYKDKENCGIKEDELLTKIHFKKPVEDEVLSFSKLGLRKALAISRISISLFVGLDENRRLKTIRVSSGALGLYPMRERDVEKFLQGKILNMDIVDKATEILQNSMDKRLEGRSTLPYKRVAVEAIFKEAFKDSLNFLNGVKR